MSDDIDKVVIDANILLSKTLRDWILRPCYGTGNAFYQVYLPQGVLDEFSYHWRKQHPQASDQARARIVKAISACCHLVEGYDVHDVPGYPDPHDLHVHAAAVHIDADALITNDSRLLNFAQSEEGEEALSYETLTADDFLLQIATYLPAKVLAGLYLSEEEYQRKTGNPRSIPEQLKICGAPAFARYLQQNIIPRLP